MTGSLKIIVNRTSEDGRWMAKVKHDRKRNETTVIFSQRSKKFDPISAIRYLKAGYKEATKVSGKYLEALNLAPRDVRGLPAAGRTQPRLDQRALDNKFKAAGQLDRSAGPLQGDLKPFARKTVDFERIRVEVHDSVPQLQARAAFCELVWSSHAYYVDGDKDADKGHFTKQLAVAWDLANGIDAHYGAQQKADALKAVKYLQTMPLKKGPAATELAAVRARLEPAAALADPVPTSAREAEAAAFRFDPSVLGKKPARPL